MAFQFSGLLEDTPLSDIARLLQSTRRTGCLSINSEGTRGSIFFDRGEMVDSHANQLSGIDAIRHLGRFNRGTFEFMDGATSAARTLTEHTTAELVEVLEVHMMEALQIQELMPQPLEIPHYLGGVLPVNFEVTAPELAVAMKATGGKFSVASVAHQLGLDVAMVSYTVARFRAAGLMDLLPPSDTPEPIPETPPQAPPEPPRSTQRLPTPTPGGNPSSGGTQPRYWRGRKIE